MLRMKKGRKEKESKRPKRDKPQESLGSGFFSFCFWCRIGCASVLRQKNRREGRGVGGDAAGCAGKTR